MRKKQKQLAEEDFQMAPMIDMVFLLLVFFMCVSTLAQADKPEEVELPQSLESIMPEDTSGRGTISLNAAGEIFVGSAKVNNEQLKNRITDALQKNPQLKILVRADQNTSFVKIKSILRTCAEAGAYEIIYATYEGD